MSVDADATYGSVIFCGSTIRSNSDSPTNPSLSAVALSRDPSQARGVRFVRPCRIHSMEPVLLPISEEILVQPLRSMKSTARHNWRTHAPGEWRDSRQRPEVLPIVSDSVRGDRVIHRSGTLEALDDLW